MAKISTLLQKGGCKRNQYKHF